MDLNYYERIEGWFDYAAIYDSVVTEAPAGATFVELGVSLGRSAIYLASRIKASGKGIKLIGVDCWDMPLAIKDGATVHAAPDGPGDITYHPSTSYETFLAHIKGADVEDILTPLRRMTVDAASLFRDESIYFVFFDASHAYEPVLADLKAWFPKVIRGGVLAGHDYEPTETPGPRTGGVGPWNVSRAVHEFFGRHRITQHANSWYFRKV